MCSPRQAAEAAAAAALAGADDDECGERRGCSSDRALCTWTPRERIDQANRLPSRSSTAAADDDDDDGSSKHNSVSEY